LGAPSFFFFSAPARPVARFFSKRAGAPLSENRAHCLFLFPPPVGLQVSTWKPGSPHRKASGRRKGSLMGVRWCLSRVFSRPKFFLFSFSCPAPPGRNRFSHFHQGVFFFFSRSSAVLFRVAVPVFSAGLGRCFPLDFFFFSPRVQAACSNPFFSAVFFFAGVRSFFPPPFFPPSFLMSSILVPATCRLFGRPNPLPLITGLLPFFFFWSPSMLGRSWAIFFSPRSSFPGGTLSFPPLPPGSGHCFAPRRPGRPLFPPSFTLPFSPPSGSGDYPSEAPVFWCPKGRFFAQPFSSPLSSLLSGSLITSSLFFF